jgi:hypothetical protein
MSLRHQRLIKDVFQHTSVWPGRMIDVIWAGNAVYSQVYHFLYNFFSLLSILEADHL